MPPDRRAFLLAAGAAAVAILAGPEWHDDTSAATDASPRTTGTPPSADDAGPTVVLPGIPPGF